MENILQQGLIDVDAEGYTDATPLQTLALECMQYHNNTDALLAKARILLEYGAKTTGLKQGPLHYPLAIAQQNAQEFQYKPEDAHACQMLADFLAEEERTKAKAADLIQVD